MKMESIQTVIRDNDHDVERCRNQGELRRKCRYVFKGKNILLSVVIAAVWVVLLVPTVIYIFPQDYTSDECDGLPDDCNSSSSGGSGETSDFKGNSSLVCSEGFFVSVEDITNGRAVEVCRPECGEWEEVPHSTVVALYITHLVTDVVYLLSGAVVLVLSVIQYKRMFRFPSVFIVYGILSVGMIEMISFIGTIGRKSLFCSSQDLIKTSDNPTVFCTLSGVVFYYLFLVAILLFFFHISSVCWGVKFPFHYNNIKQRGHFKYVHIGMVLLALLLPLASVGIALGNGGFTIAFSTSICMAKERDVGFYTILIPYSIVMAGGISLTAVILQELVLTLQLARAKPLENQLATIDLYTSDSYPMQVTGIIADTLYRLNVSSVINFQGNLITELRKSDFANISTSQELTQVDLRKNRIRSIENDTFASDNIKILHLFLAENELEDVEGVFRGGHFPILDLSYNRLRSPPNPSDQIRVIQLKLNNNPLNGLNELAFQGIKGIETLDLSFCNLTMDNVAPEAFDLPEMFTLYLDGNSFVNLNKSIFRRMPTSLLNLYMNDCGIMTLGGRTFSRMTSLTNLYLRENNIGELPPNVFKDMDMETLDLSYSNITNIVKGAFRTSIRKILRLDHNNISVIHSRDFEFLDLGVEELVLSHSNIVDIRENAFTNFPTLIKLYLDHNELHDEDIARGLTQASSLYHLDLTSNHLTTVPDLRGKNFPLVTELHLAHNDISSLRREHLRNMSTLKVLVLKGNELETIENDAIAECPYLSDLNMDQTHITHLPSLRNASHLRSLHVSDCLLESLPHDLCEHSPSLVILRATDNYLREIPPLSRCRSLFSVTLDHNEITTIENGTFAGLKALDLIKLQHNSITELPDGVFKDLDNLKYLHLQHNQIRDLPIGVFDNCQHLTILRASFNRIRELRTDLFKNNLELEEITLNNNGIKRIRGNAFPSGMIHLQHLNLSSNDFSSFEVPEKGFPNLRILSLEKLFDLHQVPSPGTIPEIQELYLTYSYHCCIWRDYVREDLKGQAPSNAPELPSTIPTEDPITLPPDLVTPAGGPSERPFLSECTSSDQLTEEDLKFYDDLAEKFNFTYTILPNCEVIINIPTGAEGGGETPIGTGSDAEFENFVEDTKSPPSLPPWEPIVCYPQSDPLTPCDNLMDPWFLRVAIWAVWVLAVLGNGTVLFVTIITHDRTKVDVSQFLICNLALADFLLGLYLAFLAVVDIRTYGSQSFYQSALDWQLGPGCKTAGFIAVFSSELSVFVLVILTLERLYSIAKVFDHNERRRMNVAIVVVIIGWIVAAGLALMPLVGINSYSQVAVCLPFVTEEPKDKSYIGLILSLNLLGFLIILVCYSYIFCRIYFSPAVDQDRREIFKAAGKISLLILSTFACWFPLAVIGYSALNDAPLVSAKEAKYFIVFAYPLNACVNPFIYAIFTRHFRQRVKSLFKRTRDKMQSFPPSHQLRITRTPNAFGSEYSSRVQSPRGPLTPEDLMKLRHSRRSNSFSVQLVDMNMFPSLVPPPPGSGRTGRRSSLPAIFGSTVHSVHAEAAANVSGRYGDLPFRLGPRYTGHNSSFPNLVEEDESEEVPREAESTFAGSQVSNDSGFRRLSVVDEEDEELEREVLCEGNLCDNASIASSESDDYSDAQDSIPERYTPSPHTNRDELNTTYSSSSLHDVVVQPANVTLCNGHMSDSSGSCSPASQPHSLHSSSVKLKPLCSRELQQTANGDDVSSRSSLQSVQDSASPQTGHYLHKLSDNQVIRIENPNFNNLNYVGSETDV